MDINTYILVNWLLTAWPALVELKATYYTSLITRSQQVNYYVSLKAFFLLFINVTHDLYER